MGKKHFCFFETAETGNRTPNSGVKGSGANHYPRAPALRGVGSCLKWILLISEVHGWNWVNSHIIVQCNRPKYTIFCRNVWGIMYNASKVFLIRFSRFMSFYLLLFINIKCAKTNGIVYHDKIRRR